METKNLPLTHDQANVLLGLLDIAVKSQGLAVAQNAVYFTQQVEGLFAQKEEVKEEDKKDDDTSKGK